MDDHVVRWNDEFQLHVDLTVDEETDILEPHFLRLSVRKVRPSSRSLHARRYVKAECGSEGERRGSVGSGADVGAGETPPTQTHRRN